MDECFGIYIGVLVINTVKLPVFTYTRLTVFKHNRLTHVRIDSDFFRCETVGKSREICLYCSPTSTFSVRLHHVLLRRDPGRPVELRVETRDNHPFGVRSVYCGNLEQKRTHYFIIDGPVGTKILQKFQILILYTLSLYIYI